MIGGAADDTTGKSEGAVRIFDDTENAAVAVDPSAFPGLGEGVNLHPGVEDFDPGFCEIRHCFPILCVGRFFSAVGPAIEMGRARGPMVAISDPITLFFLDLGKAIAGDGLLGFFIDRVQGCIGVGKGLLSLLEGKILSGGEFWSKDEENWKQGDNKAWHGERMIPGA